MQRLGHVVVCPHITLLGPFVDRDDVDENLLTAIREILAPTQSFAYELASVGRFSDGTVYVAPDPDEPFIQLTRLLYSAFPQWPPYGGAFDDVVPHASIGKTLSEAALAALRVQLPISATARAVTLTWWSHSNAEELARFPLSRFLARQTRSRPRLP